MAPTLFLLFSTSITHYFHGNNSNLVADLLTDNLDDNPVYNEYKDLLANQAQTDDDDNNNDNDNNDDDNIIPRGPRNNMGGSPEGRGPGLRPAPTVVE